MRSRRSGEWLIGLLSLAIVTAVHGGPTVSTSHDDVRICATPASESLDVPSSGVSQVDHIGDADNLALARIANELLKPPADSPLSTTATLPIGATSLPPVPGALFMTLTGFLCVSLARDRKVWTAALVGLLWAGQVGVTALPQLARYLAGRGRTEQLYSPSLTRAEAPDDLDRLRSDIEGTTYIGLLHYLAGIPAVASSVQCRAHARITKRYTLHAKRYRDKAPQTALTEARAHILPATNRLAYITKQHACFSPAFIFENLARGPPLSAWERSLKHRFTKCIREDTFQTSID